MIGHRTYPWAWRQVTGTLKLKNILSHTVGYTETRKMVAAPAAASVLAATATVVAGTTITAGITNPDVPRNLTITTGGTTANIAAGSVTIHGTNIEGKVISEAFVMADNLNDSVVGNLAFKTVTSVVFPAADGTSATISVGVGSKLGLNHRLITGSTAIVVIQDTGTTATVQAGPSATAFDAEEVENNTITPSTAPDGTTFLTIVYWYHKVSLAQANDMTEYFTSTSTSSSTSSTSTSSTSSSSTSSSSTSSSSTSSSTSMTSTSTTTVA